jgi:arylsulfatase A-like enzyme
VAAAVAAAWYRAPAPQPPAPRLVVLFAPCTVNKSYLAPYDPVVEFTPHLRAFAEQSVTFLNHNTEAAASGIAYASLFSGTQADRHGVFQHPTTLSDEVYLIGEAYADHGYESFFWDGHGAASAALNYAQGVKPENVYPDPFTLGNDERLVRILDRLRADPTYKALIIASFTLTHGPYRTGPLQKFIQQYPRMVDGISPAELDRYVPLYRTHHLPLSWSYPHTVERLGLSPAEVGTLARVVQLLYRSNVWELDQLFGQVTDAIRARGLFEESLVVFTADHGEAFDRRNLAFKWAHSGQLAHEVLGIPLLIHAPPTRVRPGSVYRGVSRSIDVFPTMLGLSGIELPPGRVDGRDLSPYLDGSADPPELIAFSHTQVLPNVVFQQMQNKANEADWTEMKRFYPRPDIDLVWVAARQGDRLFKFRNLDGIEWGFQMFDLAQDPTESVNLFDANDPAHASMAGELRAYKARLAESHSAAGRRGVVLREKDAAAMRQLGYIR